VLPGKKLKPEDLLAIVWRRKWWVIVPFVLVTAATVLVSRTLPDRYQSETLMLVVPQRVPESYVRATVTTRLEDRLRSIQAQILSRTKLEQIIRDADLYPELRKRLPMEDVVELVRADVKVETVRGDAFRVTYTSENPKKAMEVAASLASAFRDESLRDRAVLADSTTEFLESQLEEARGRLVEAENKKADFQRRHAGALPSEQASNLTVLHNLELQVQALLDSINRDRDRRLFLERTLADLEAEAQTLRAAAGSTVASPPADAVAGVVGTTPADQLEAARKTLRSLEMRFTPEHPDVVYMKRIIRDLEAKVAAEASARPADAPARPAEPPARARTPEELAVQRRIQETQQELDNVQIQLASKAEEEKRLRGRIAALQRLVAATPGLEAEYTALTRDYETLQNGYAILLGKFEDAKAAAKLEERQIGEQFKLLDPARLPESPVTPNRFLINLMGALAGLGLGLGLVGLVEYRDNTLKTEEDVLSVLSIPVLAAIPVIETSRDRARKKRRRVMMGLAGAAVVALLIAGAAVVVWAVGVQRVSNWFR
jgi:polysaccharide chain length determinant protein (PEP-CTERM system associated)